MKTHQRFQTRVKPRESPNWEICRAPALTVCTLGYSQQVSFGRGGCDTNEPSRYGRPRADPVRIDSHIATDLVHTSPTPTLTSVGNSKERRNKMATTGTV